jgi:predicted nucleotidyltransferase
MNDPEFAIRFDRDAIVEFCRKWKIAEMSLFGSVLNPAEFRDDSDVDVLVVFEPGPFDWGPWASKWDEMSLELEAIFGRKADIVERSLVKNPFIRHSILTSRRKIYAA